MTLASGTKLGRYEIRAKIGEGGMGEVYRALDTELGRTVAIKILPERLSSDQQRLQRFIQEARSASALNHPHIITIFEIGQADALRFIVSEFIDGDTLRRRIGLDPVNHNEVIEIGTQTASALSAAHAAGIIHRDIKPENIMVRRDGYVKLLDFGLAKLTEPRESITDAEAPTKALVNTDAGTVMGTANYMSPEQAKGIKVDARTDLWSLGAVLYEMITSHLPFAGETPTETISLILQKEPAALTRYAHEVPAELERIVTKALTKDREERYQTAKDMLIDLRNLKRKLEVDAEIDRTVPTEFRAALSTSGGQGAPGTASGASGATTPAGSIHAASSAEYLVSGIKQHKIAAAIVGILLVLGGVGIGVHWHARSTEVAIESIAVLPFVNTSGDANTDYLTDGITESLINSFSQLPGLRVIPRGTVFRYKGKETDPVAVGKELGVRALLTGRVTQRGDNLSVSVELVDLRDNKQLWGEQYERKASDLLAMQHDIAQEITGNLRPKLSGTEQSRMNKHYTENPEAYQLYLKGRYFWNRFSPADHQKAAQYFNQAIAKDRTYALAYTGLADTYGASATNGWIPSTEGYQKGMAAVKKALELDETLAEAHCTLGALTMFYLLDWATAEREYKRAIELNPNYSTTYQVYSYLLSATGRLTEAIEIARRGSEIDPLSIPLSNDLGQACYLARRYDEAIKQYQKTNEMDPNHNGTYGALGYAYDQKGMYAEALAAYQKGIALSERTSSFLAAMGHAYAASGRKGEALKILDEMKEVSKQKYVSPYDLAILYTGLGDKDQAIEQLNKAYEEHAGWIIDLRAEPMFDPLRSDPRFADLIRRLGLPQ